MYNSSNSRQFIVQEFISHISIDDTKQRKTNNLYVLDTSKYVKIQDINKKGKSNNHYPLDTSKYKKIQNKQENMSNFNKQLPNQ